MKTNIKNKAKAKTHKKPSLCWKCKNAVPSATCGCSWSRDAVPVDGWEAEKHTGKRQSNEDYGVYESYNVKSCPKFEKDNKIENHCKDDNACLRIAELILRSQMNRYRAALDNYARTGKHLAEVTAVERELLTPYYASLTMYSVDLFDVCNEYRRQVGLPELEGAE